ncbi:12737_t:CDS:2 [Ambispora gerdemannii]|uniref:12737_t:CDS:1 n=1 Tax=Ambispora gerdemannii TaxID=144530 RepID=A0A9N9D1L2_9GLOM|nr:12737_t:CDS:2 [Ambispora gerdemannii]
METFLVSPVIQGFLPSRKLMLALFELSRAKGFLPIQHWTTLGHIDLLGRDDALVPQPDRKKARDWEEKRSRRQTHIHQPINGNVGNVIGNINGTISFKTSFATSKRGLNREKNKDEVTKRTKIESQDLPIETDSEESIEDKPKASTPPPFSYISSECESDEDYKSDKDDDSFNYDMKAVSFDDYLNPNKTKSEWKLEDGRLIIDIARTKTAEAVKLAMEKKNERTQFMKSVIRLGLSSIVDLSSEFENGMCTWFGQEWTDIKRKVYEIVNMEPNVFEGEITNVIDTVEEESSLLSSAHIYITSLLMPILAIFRCAIVQQIATIYFYVIDEFLKNPSIFVDKTGKYKEISEIEYAMAMTAPILNNVFSDVFDYLELRWGETLSNTMPDRRRKIDLRIVHKTKKIELSHSESAKAPTPGKAVQDRSKCLRTLKGVLDNFLKEDLSDEEVQDSKILGIQFAGIDLLDDGLYFGLEGPTFSFPAQLTNVKCLRSALEALYFFKQEIVKKNEANT